VPGEGVFQVLAMLLPSQDGEVPPECIEDGHT
jgi:hypothetical protein